MPECRSGTVPIEVTDPKNIAQSHHVDTAIQQDFVGFCSSNTPQWYFTCPIFGLMTSSYTYSYHLLPVHTSALFQSTEFTPWVWDLQVEQWKRHDLSTFGLGSQRSTNWAITAWWETCIGVVSPNTVRLHGTCLDRIASIKSWNVSIWCVSVYLSTYMAEVNYIVIRYQLYFYGLP